jgi:beta-glucanase (GH16 family)
MWSAQLAIPAALAIAALLVGGLTGGTSPVSSASARVAGASGGASGAKGSSMVTASWSRRQQTTTTTTPTTVPPSTTTTSTSTTTTTTSTTTPAAPTACGGEVVAKASGGDWQCTLDDEFGGSSLDSSKWVVQTTAGSALSANNACLVNSPNNVSVANGVLSLTVREEAAPFTCTSPGGSFQTQYTGGMVDTWGLFSQAYGRFEVRAKLPATAAQGLQETLWLYPQALKYGAWPASGEIDFAEFFSMYHNLDVPYIHYNQGASDPNVTAYNCSVSDWSQFHTYAVEWTPSSITILYDGSTCLVDRWTPASPLIAPQPFDQPFIICLTQGLGYGANAVSPGTTPLPATTEIDYVRAWK